MKGFKEFINLTAQKKCPEGYRFDKKLGVCVPIGHKGYYPYYGYRNGGNGNGGNGGGNGSSGGESYIVSDVRKMPDGGYGVYADKFVKGKGVMTPGGKHKKELKKVYRSKTKANKYMAAIMIGNGG